MSSRIWVERVQLTDFRNYAGAVLEVGPEPVVLVGANGSGKTNFLEAVSLLAPGQGLRRAAFTDLARAGGGGGWAVAARVHTRDGARDIGTGQPSTGQPSGGQPGNAPTPSAGGDRSGRTVRVDGTTARSSGILADLVEAVWVTPAMDGLFTGPASERRRFLDRLILCFDPAHGPRASRFERAMQNRNRLLADGIRGDAQLAGFEVQMAETGVAMAAARVEALAALADVIAARRARDAASSFPWASVVIEGQLEQELALRPAIEVEEFYARSLAEGRERDRAAGRTLAGPHRADLVVGHGPKDMPARLSSTGEQKALLLGLVLAQTELIAARNDGTAPLLLLDEVTAHFDPDRRAALFAEIERLGVQAWMTGTDLAAFDALGPAARRIVVDHGRLSAVPG